jgi:hypothetical protein
MLYWLGEWFRKLSIILMIVGGLVAFFTEVFADVPLDRRGRPKPPMAVQRLNYLALIGAGVPGAAWAAIRTYHGKPPSWD